MMTKFNICIPSETAGGHARYTDLIMNIYNVYPLMINLHVGNFIIKIMHAQLNCITYMYYM